MVSWARGFLLGGRSARVGQTHLVTVGLLLLPVPPSVVDEDLEEAVKVPEGQTAHLTCNATGKGHTQQGWEKGEGPGIRPACAQPH